MPDTPLAFFVDLEPAVADFQESVIEGLSKTPKQLACKFFYDEVGLDLFGKICETEEYYVTRTELALMRQIGPELAELAGPQRTVIELGSGSDLKIRLLLDALTAPAQYVPIDISPVHLRASAEAVASDYPETRVGAVCADFTAPLSIPADAIEVTDGARLGYFPGSTIGNLTPMEAESFLRGLHPLLGPNGALLIGVDLRKDTGRLNRAYNDAAGYTAAFNLNILHRIAGELDSSIDPAGFEHYAFYNEAEGRIEMHLRSRHQQSIRVGESRFELAADELIHTENSYKYSLDGFAALAASAGYRSAARWTDAEDLFSIHYLTLAA
ncbi:MAG: L-histidine N(alpha)-methyltransferase [Rhodospirillaceae bacterium]|nr:L-histidine N(alpha)-methyltransferase [Rhodospirillaceae bacterium]MDD9926706.1 L-histidine N(alpha)-methyltransferase [Rhodospirillaceae bacterium]